MSHSPEQFLRLVQMAMSRMGLTFDEALAMIVIPPDLLEQVQALFQEETALPERHAVILSGRGGRKEWFSNHPTAEGFYWNRQRQYLMEKIGRSPREIDSLDDASDAVLAHLEDPSANGPDSFSTRGLIMGYVQSGKTANFCAVAAKAADAGYGLIIVLSGIDNALRLQTQRRLNQALGVDASGVPLPEPGMRWIDLTKATLNGDFRQGTVSSSVLQPKAQVLLVCKKNAMVLRRLIAWMQAKPLSKALSVLVIDDESDQATINTGGNRATDEPTDLLAEDQDIAAPGKERDPSIINGLIRELMRTFTRVAYIAYTATPYANMFIDHEAYDKFVEQDLYPRDFIISLPEPHGYTGAQRLFGRASLPGEQDEILPLPIWREIPVSEAETLRPSAQLASSFFAEITDSLRLAVRDFILATAARLTREKSDIPATMLVHCHHMIAVHNELGEALDEHVMDLRRRWRYSREDVRPEFRARWESDFQETTAEIKSDGQVLAYMDLEAAIDSIFKFPVPVLVINSSSAAELDFQADPYLKAIVVGGNRLSRGLTLEGLLVSYYIRPTDYYDTLMQMGRWFGFRESYVDLTRIWTTKMLWDRFRDLSLAEDELRMEIARYERERLTPLDFGPKIRSHPNMLITARNKMGSATRLTLSFSGSLVQTVVFNLDDREWLGTNLNAAAALVSALGAPVSLAPRFPSPTWREVPWQMILRFLSQYQTDPRGKADFVALQKYIERQIQQGDLQKWDVAVRGLQTHDPKLGAEPLLGPFGQPAWRIRRTQLKETDGSIGALISPSLASKSIWGGDEEIGMSMEAIESARQAAKDGDNFQRALRRERDRGLLLLYPISPASEPSETDKYRRALCPEADAEWPTIVGVAVVLPDSANAATIEYMVGSVGQKSHDS